MSTEAHEIRVATQNVQVGIGSQRQHHILSHSWRYLLPHSQSLPNLASIAEDLGNMDIIGLNEVDAGSFRSQYLNQASFLAERCALPYWAQQRTRNWGDVAQHSNCLLSRWPILEQESIRFHGTLGGRGVLRSRLQVGERVLEVFLTHLALGPSGRLRQIRQILTLLQGPDAKILLGDLNCGPQSRELTLLREEGGLRGPEHQPATFPSWSPRRPLDHILISSDLGFSKIWTIHQPHADHLPLMAVLRWSTDREVPAHGALPSPETASGWTGGLR